VAGKAQEETMRRTLTFVTLLVSISLGQDVLLACGDKFFLVGRGDVFSRAYASLHPGSVVIYAGGTSEISKGLRDARMPKFLRNAGHRVLIVTDSRELEQLLRTESVDVILTDLRQAVDLEPRVVSAPSEPTLLPIRGKDRAGAASSPRRFAATLKESDNIKVLLDTIEKLMKARARSNARR
jgi:hypothetical protein